MSGVLHAIETFFGHLASVGWTALGLAVLCHVAKMAARARAWRNIVAAAYPDARVRWRSVFGSYAAGVGVNAIVPARGGDLLRLYLAKHRVEGATYPTLAATLLVEAVFDVVVATLLLVWAVRLGVLPGLDVVARLPAVDWLWLFREPFWAAALALVLFVGGFALGMWLGPRVHAFRRRVAQGFAVLRTPRRYVLGVAGWQAVDWSLRIASLVFFLRAFGIDAGLHNALLVQVTQSLSTLLPLTPAGIGTEQALLVYVFSGEAGATAVLSFSVGMKIVLIATNVAVGFTALALMLRTVRWRRVVGRDASLPGGVGGTERAKL